MPNLTLALLNDHQGSRADRQQEINASIDSSMEWLKKKKRKAFYAPVAGNFREGTSTLLQVSAMIRKLQK